MTEPCYISRCRFDGLCTNGNGGAITTSGIMVQLVEDTFVNCSSGSRGGAVFHSGESFTVNHTSFIECSAVSKDSDGGNGFTCISTVFTGDCIISLRCSPTRTHSGDGTFHIFHIGASVKNVNSTDNYDPGYGPCSISLHSNSVQSTAKFMITANCCAHNNIESISNTLTVYYAIFADNTLTDSLIASVSGCLDMRFCSFFNNSKMGLYQSNSRYMFDHCYSDKKQQGLTLTSRFLGETFLPGCGMSLEFTTERTIKANILLFIFILLL